MPYIVKRLPAQKALKETVVFQGEDKNGKETWVHTEKKAKRFPCPKFKEYNSKYKYEWKKVLE
jgi:hypothetical protein